MLDKSNESTNINNTDLDYDVPRPRRKKIFETKIYARALYDNEPDSPDELSFKKGDILNVIEQDESGWWNCSLRGRQGLCPGNRLRILNSYDSGCFSLSPPSSPSPSLAASTATLNSSICSTDIYENSSIISSIGSHAGGNINGSGSISASQTQLNTKHHFHHHHHQQQHQQQSQLQKQQLQFLQTRQGTRRSWHASPNKVITPQRHGDVYIYQYQQQQPQQQQQQHKCQTAQPEEIYSNQSIYQNISMMSTTGSNNGGSNNEFENYDIPKPATPVNYDCPKNIVCRTPNLSITGSQHSLASMDRMSLSMKGCSTPIQEESYDIPRPLNASILQNQQNSLTPSSSNSSLLTSDSLSLSFSSSNRSSLANMPDYDIPRRNPLPVRAVHQSLQQQQQKQQYINNSCMTYDFPVPSTLATVQEKSTQPQNSTLLATAVAETKELPLELSSALETLVKLQLEATTAITRLLAFVSPNWRLREKLEPVLMEVKLSAVRLRAALHDLTEFAEGTLGNAQRSEDRNLALKLRPLVRALRDADKLIRDSSDTLDARGGWTIENLARSDSKTSCKPPDSLDQLIACAQTLTEDVRSTTSFIQGNASLLFKRSLPEQIDITDAAGNSNTTENNETATTPSVELLEDYDYVSFESKDAAAKKNSSLREAIPQSLKKKFDTVIKAAETTAMEASNAVPPVATKKNELTTTDKLLVRYYAVQISTHMGNLQQAIDSFFETVEKNQPPKYFIAYGKFVVVSAHNLVTTGDIVHRNVTKKELKEKILRCTDTLNEALRTCVNKSRKAAAHFPSVIAVQEMVDAVYDISRLAVDLKTTMLQAVQMTL